MNDKTGGTRGPRRAGALAVMAAVAVLATACGSGDPASYRAVSGRPTTLAQLVALAQCMRSHGAPNFPDPSTSGGFDLTTNPNGSHGAIDIDSRQIQAAYRGCRHLLAGGGPNISQLRHQIQQEQKQALPGLLKFAQCMRGHGVPSFPDPTPNGLNLHDAGISPTSPQFQAAVRACHHALPAGMHISVSTQVG